MPSGAIEGPVTALTFDSTLLERDDGFSLSLKRGLGEVATVRGVDTVIPGRAGRVFRARVADRMALELEGNIIGIGTFPTSTDAEAYYALVLEAQDLFDPTKDPAVLSCVLPDGSTATINVRVVPPILWDEKVPGLAARLNVALESVDPDWVITAP